MIVILTTVQIIQKKKTYIFKKKNVSCVRNSLVADTKKYNLYKKYEKQK